MKTALCVLIGLGFCVIMALICRAKCREYEREFKTLEEEPIAEIWRISAYCPCEKCCGKWADGYTASGKPAVGRIIAAPPEIPFGTTIYIKGYGYGVVQDRGGAIKGKRLDVLFPTHEQALEWGVKFLNVEIIK